MLACAPHRTTFNCAGLPRRTFLPCQRALTQRSAIANALQLVPCGDGSIEHLGSDQSKDLGEAPTIELDNGLFEVGRAAPADIVVPVPSVSGRHAMLRVDDERVNVTDLRSTNGTYIDGTEITAMQAYEVLPGSNIIFGDEHLAMFELRIVENSGASGDSESNETAEKQEASST